MYKHLTKNRLFSIPFFPTECEISVSYFANAYLYTYGRDHPLNLVILVLALRRVIQRTIPANYYRTLRYFKSHFEPTAVADTLIHQFNTGIDSRVTLYYL